MLSDRGFAVSVTVMFASVGAGIWSSVEGVWPLVGFFYGVAAVVALVLAVAG